MRLAHYTLILRGEDRACISMTTRMQREAIMDKMRCFPRALGICPKQN